MTIKRTESGISPAKYKHIIEEITESGTILSIGTDNTVLTPPAGKLWEILNMYLMASDPIGATSGTHSFTLLVGNINVLRGKSIFSSDLKWDYSVWALADSEQIPSSDAAAQNALTSVKLTQETPLTVRYFNGTDVSQILGRYIRFSILESPLI